jgi:ribonucleoside-diphosphate reductase alpha chain
MLTGDIEVNKTHSYQLDNGVVSHNSVLLMTASGIGGEHSELYLRNVQMSKEAEVAQVLKRTNPYMVEDSVWSVNKTDYVISFPVIAPKDSIFKDDLLGIKHLELIAKAQKYWVEAGTNIEYCVDPTVRHNISNTVTVDDWDEVEEYVFENRHSFAGISFLGMSGDKDYDQAPFTKVLTANQIIETYSTGSIFASGLVVESLKAFGNLWSACTTAYGIGEDISSDDAENLLKKDWVRRFEQFANNYFNGVKKDAEYCLKDVYLLHKWEKIQRNLVDIDWKENLFEKKFISVDTTGAAACVGNGVEGCLI